MPIRSMAFVVGRDSADLAVKLGVAVNPILDGLLDFTSQHPTLVNTPTKKCQLLQNTHFYHQKLMYFEVINITNY